MKLEPIVLLVAGTWSLGIGTRFTYELLTTSGYVSVPSHPINLYFDFLPLAILGTLTVLIAWKRIYRGMKEKNPKEKLR